MKPKIRIFISSPGDVAEEREKARQVVESLQRLIGPEPELEVVMWEDLALNIDVSAQQSIEQVLEKDHGIDVAVFILWSRLGSPLSKEATPKLDGSGGCYRSGTEHELDLMMKAREKSGGKRPHILAYWRQDEEGFLSNLKNSGPDSYDRLLEQKELAKEFIEEQFMDEEGRNVRGIVVYAEPVSFARRLHSHLRQVLDELLASQVGGVKWLESPYRGLEAFDVEHAPIFHGREEETHAVMEALRRSERNGECAFVAIVGASGSGKSSLARAGVAAGLRERSFDEEVKQWRIGVMMPSLCADRLCLGLVEQIAAVVPELKAGGVDLDGLAGDLASNPESAVRLAVAPAFKRAGEKADGSVRLLLVLDQMEELWTDPAIEEASRESFFAALDQLSRSGAVAIVATLRSDFYPQSQHSEGFLRLKGECGNFDLPPPGRSALLRVIETPARAAGLSFERRDDTGEYLAGRIFEEAALDPESLPLLQYALAELYLRRDERKRMLTFAAYEEMGGIEGVLGRRANDLFVELSPQAQDAVDEVFPLLVTIDIDGDQSVVRRRARLARLTETESRRELTEALISARFLATNDSRGEAVAGLAHEALLHRWERLAQWVRRNRHFLGLRGFVEQDEVRWREQENDPSLLLPSGFPLEEGKRLLEEGRSLLRDSTAEYIETSIRHHEGREALTRRRRRVAVSSLAALAAVACIGAIAATQQAAVAKREKLRADQALREIGVANLDILRGNADAAHEAGRYADEAVWLGEATAAGEHLGVDTRMDALRQRALLPLIDQIMWQLPYRGTVNRVVAALDGELLFVGSSQDDLFVGQRDDEGWQFEALFPAVHGKIVAIESLEEEGLLCVATNDFLAAYPLTGFSGAAAPQPKWIFAEVREGSIDGAMVRDATASSLWLMAENRLYRIDAGSGEVLQRIELQLPPSVKSWALRVAPEGSRAAIRVTANEQRELAVVDTATGEVLASYPRLGGQASSLQANGDYCVHAGIGSAGVDNGGIVTIVPWAEPEKGIRWPTPWILNSVSAIGEDGFELTCADGVLRKFSFGDGLAGATSIEADGGALHLVADAAAEASTNDPGQGFWMATAQELSVHPAVGVAADNRGGWGADVRDLAVVDDEQFFALQGERLELRNLEDCTLVGSVEVGQGAHRVTVSKAADRVFLFDTEKGVLSEFRLSDFEFEGNGRPAPQCLGTISEVLELQPVIAPVENAFYVATERGLYRYLLSDEGAGTPAELILADTVAQIAQLGYSGETDAEEGESYGTVLGVVRANGSGNRYELAVYWPDLGFFGSLVVPDSPLPEETSCVRLDDIGLLAFGSKSGGTVVYDLQTLLDQLLFESGFADEAADPPPRSIAVLPDEGEDVLEIATTSDGQLLVARDGPGLLRVMLDSDYQVTDVVRFEPFRDAVLKVVSVKELRGHLLLSKLGGIARYLPGGGVLGERKPSEHALGGSGVRGELRSGFSIHSDGADVVIEMDDPEMEEPLRLEPRKMSGGVQVERIHANEHGTVVVSATDRGELHVWRRGDEDGAAITDAFVDGQPMPSWIAQESLDFSTMEYNTVHFASPQRVIVGDGQALHVVAIPESADEPPKVLRRLAPLREDGLPLDFDRAVTLSDDRFVLAKEVDGEAMIHIFEPSAEQVRSLSVPDLPRSLTVIGPDRVLVGGSGSATLVDAVAGEVLWTVKLRERIATTSTYYVRSALHLPETELVAVGRKQTISLIDLESGLEVQTLPVADFVWDLALDKENSRLNWTGDFHRGSIPVPTAGKESEQDVEERFGRGVRQGKIVRIPPPVIVAPVSDTP